MLGPADIQNENILGEQVAYLLFQKCVNITVCFTGTV
jgi:hypothetical protein